MYCCVYCGKSVEKGIEYCGITVECVFNAFKCV